MVQSNTSHDTDQHKNQSVTHYQLVANAICFIRENHTEQPSLGTLAAHLGVSAFHLQRVFSQWAGLSPKRFLQYTTRENLLQKLHMSKNLLDASYAAGLSSPSRLHDLMVRHIAMTPGEVKAKGKGVTVAYAFGTTPFGPALLGWTDKGLCYLGFTDDTKEDKDTALKALQGFWSNARFQQAAAKGQRLLDAVFSNTPVNTSVVLHGSSFQIKVWEALIKTPPNTLISYSDLSKAIGLPKAQRAVGNAVGKNHIAFLIPCHRVIQENGSLGDYRWGSTRKLAIQAWESARQNTIAFS